MHSLTLDLSSATEALRSRFGTGVDLPYVPGKTAFRDVICEIQGLSQAEAEAVCDSLEQAGVIRFERSATLGNRWTLDPSASQSRSR